MKKIISKIVVLFLVLTAVCGVAAFVGCTPSEVTYTVTVKDEDGNGLSGVMVIICDPESHCDYVETDSTGEVVVTIAPMEYTIHIAAEGYECDTELTTSLKSSSYEFIAKAVNQEPDEGEVTYTFTVKYPDGTGAAGVLVAVCSGELCNMATTTADGVATYKTEAKEYDVHLENIPEGYTCTDTKKTSLTTSSYEFILVANS